MTRTSISRRPDRVGRCRCGAAGVVSVTLALLLPLAGCNVIGVAAYKLTPPPKIPALYVPAQEPMVVLAENYDSPAATRVDAERLTRHVTEQLYQNAVAPMIDPADVERLREQSPAEFRKMAIPAVGRAVGAGQVLYVHLTRFDVDQAYGSDMFRGTAEARVRVVDATTGETRWPLDTADGYPVEVQTPYARTSDTAAEATLRREIYQTMADEIARLFYAWSTDGIDTGTPIN